MKKMNLPVIAVSVVAVCMVAIVATLAFKATSSPDIEADVTGSIGNNSNYYNQYEEITTSPFQAIVNTTAQVIENTYVPSTQATTKKPEPSTQKPTKPATTVSVSEMQEEVTLPELNPDEMSQGVATKPVQSTGDLPQDMTFAGLSRMGYDVIGLKPYIFNDDKDPECFQKQFGYNPLYDFGANLIDFSIETTKLDFDYDGKEYRIQLWKGQYISGEIGTVGGEIGVYNRPEIRTGEHYDCAEQDDWLKMEMTVYWDEFDNGEYLPQFSRNYNDFWWCTGFVDGQLKNRRDSNTMRLLGRITFETEEQAELFDEAMDKKGFTKVEEFSPYEIDTYKRHGKDVIFLWQNIR
ncbi:MAG: DUF4474 domain-containing protein [Clostridia bacterium]|nr:DUF4474 domain-containing protein [Clostridia bacterium]